MNNTYLTDLTQLSDQPKPSHPTFVTRTALQLRPMIGSLEPAVPLVLDILPSGFGRGETSLTN
jgi:hypothetical protein